jgi:phospholipid/cholesterol/gamma-HCH transport system permease protein
MLDRLARLGREINLRVEGFGHFARFCGAAGYWTLRQPAGYGRLHLLLPQLYTIGVRSIPVVMLVGAFVGAVIGIETYAQFASFGQETRLGGVIALSVVKQIGPVLAAVMIAGRVGGAVSAEVGTMRVTEQLDALRVMGTDPVQHLVVPRVLACVIMLPILTVFSNLLGIAGGFGVVSLGFGVDRTEYWDFSAHLVTSWDVFTGLIKSLVFGLFIGLIACYKGFNCESGAAGVGKAATQSFVLGFIAIIISNFFLAQFLNTLAPLIDGLATPTAADAG